LERTTPVGVDDIAPPLPAEHNERAPLGVSGDHARNHIGCPRSDAADHHRWFAPDAGIGLGHVRCRCLVAGVDKAHAIVVQLGQEGVKAPIQDAEQDGDPLLV